MSSSRRSLPHRRRAETGHPVFVGSLADSHENTGCLRVLRQITALHRSRCCPDGQSRPVGVLEFRFSAPVNFDDECQTLLVSVAQHC